MGRQVPLNEIQRIQQAACGAQDELVIVAVPAAGNTALVGKRLYGQTLAVNGDYYCLIPLSGVFTEMQVHVKATFGSGTVTTAGPDTLYYVSDAQTPSTWTVKTSGTGDGALTTTVLQSPTVTGMKGEQYAMFKLTVAGGASAVFTQAEYNGY